MGVNKSIKVWVLSGSALVLIGAASALRPAVEDVALPWPATFGALSEVELAPANTVPFRMGIIAGLDLSPGSDPDELPFGLREQLMSLDDTGVGIRPHFRVVAPPPRAPRSRDDKEEGFLYEFRDLESTDMQLGGKWLGEPSWGWLADDVMDKKKDRGDSSSDILSPVPGLRRERDNTRRERDAFSRW